MIQDREFYKVKELAEEGGSSNKLIGSRGTKNIMGSIQDLIKNKQIEEANIESEE